MTSGGSGIAGVVDFHVHTGPSLMPRHGTDSEFAKELRELGHASIVLKAHEGCTAVRASLAGPGVHGGVVLNSCVGGANPDAVEVSARLGGRVVWFPTVSAESHQRRSHSPQLAVHHQVSMRVVPVLSGGILRPIWNEVFEVVAQHDMVLASGHVTAREAVVAFREARKRGVRRFLVNHPLLDMVEWGDDESLELQRLGVHLELGVVPDLLVSSGRISASLATSYPSDLLVFGSDLGHGEFPRPSEVLTDWFRRLDRAVGTNTAIAILTSNGSGLLDR